MSVVLQSASGKAPPRTRRRRASGSRWSRKHHAILTAATDLFLAEGYGPTTMEAVAERAQVSKATLYAHFGNKASLFEAIVVRLCDQLFEPIRRRVKPPLGPKATLLALAKRYLDLLLDPASLGLYRALVAEHITIQDLGVRSYNAGAGAATAELASHLDRWRDEGVLAIDDSHAAAELFFGMLTGHGQLRALLGVGPSPSARDREHLAVRAVDAFLRAFMAPDCTDKSTTHP